MSEENGGASERRKSVLNVGVTRYSQPLRASDAKKLSRLRTLAEFHVVGFFERTRFVRAHEPVELYLLPLLPLAAVRFSLLLLVSVSIGLRLASKRQLDIVLSQSPFEGLAGVLVRAVAGWFGRPIAVITEVHGDWAESPFLYRSIPFTRPTRAVLDTWAKFILRRSDAIRTISGFLESKVNNAAPAVPVRRFPGYTDFELFGREPREHDGNGPLIAVGGLYPVKGFSHLVRAMKRIVRERPGTVLEIAGEGPLMTPLEKLAREQGVADNVRFLGAVSQDELSALYRSARVGVLPSLSEGLGRVVWEAMASGLPVVASNVGGIPDLVTDGETGFLVPPGDESLLAERILFLLNHPDEALTMGSRAKKAVRRRFSTNQYVEDYRALFDAVS